MSGDDISSTLAGSTSKACIGLKSIDALCRLTGIAHCDGTYETPDRTERSYFTLHLYLNDAEGKNGTRQLEGGATTFFNWSMTQRMDVVPKVGRVLLFQHRDLLHSGDDVIRGTKLTLRTDVMYALEEKTVAKPEA
jgi:hypothetical protein